MVPFLDHRPPTHERDTRHQETLPPVIFPESSNVCCKHSENQLWLSTGPVVFLVRGNLLNLTLKNTKIMGSGPITSWKIEGGKGKAVTDFLFLGSKISMDCSHRIWRRLLLGRKAMTNLDSKLKSRDITFLTKVHTVKAMVFSVVMYGCESWTIKKAENWRTDAFKLWCWKDSSESLGQQEDQTSQY